MWAASKKKVTVKKINESLTNMEIEEASREVPNPTSLACLPSVLIELGKFCKWHFHSHLKQFKGNFCHSKLYWIQATPMKFSNSHDVNRLIPLSNWAHLSHINLVALLVIFARIWYSECNVMEPSVEE